jgi:pilus assembly protein CpaE
MIGVLKSSRPNDPLPKVIMNQLGIAKRPEISAADFSKAVGVPISGAIPFDAQNFGVAQGNGQMLMEIAPKSKAAAAISGLVQQLAPQEKQPKKSAATASLLDRIISLRKK